MDLFLLLNAAPQAFSGIILQGIELVIMIQIQLVELCHFKFSWRFKRDGYWIKEMVCFITIIIYI